VLDPLGHQTGPHLARLTAWLLGALLVAIGLLATVVAIPSEFVTLGDLMGRWQHEQVFPPEVVVSTGGRNDHTLRLRSPSSAGDRQDA